MIKIIVAKAKSFFAYFIHLLIVKFRENKKVKKITKIISVSFFVSKCLIIYIVLKYPT